MRVGRNGTMGIRASAFQERVVQRLANSILGLTTLPATKESEHEVLPKDDSSTRA